MVVGEDGYECTVVYRLGKYWQRGCNGVVMLGPKLETMTIVSE